MKKKLLILYFLIAWLSGYSQLHEHDKHKEHAHYHIESKTGIGAATALVYLPYEKAYAFGYHVHVLRLFNEQIGAGLGYEAIAGDTYHQTITVFGKFFLTDYLSVNVGPGLSLPNTEHQEYLFTGHLEIATAFDLWHLHVGPMLGYGFSVDDSHLSIGMHIGWHF